MKNTIEKQLSFTNSEGSETTANQAYKDAQDKGYKGSFAQFMAEYGNKGYVKSGLDIIGQIKGLFQSGTPEPAPASYTPTPDVKTSATFLGMPMWAGITVTVVAVSLVGYGIYHLTKK